MPWFKVDDKLHDHRKARTAAKAAMGVWVLAGSWSADNLMNGFVPASVLPRWGTTSDAKRLVEAGLWHPDEQDGERGWRFHEWEKYQPSRESVEAERAEARARMAELRANRKANKAKGSENVRPNNGGTSGEVRSAPTRPDPTVVPDGTTTTTAPRRGTRIPDDFAVDDLMRAWVRENVPGLDAEAATVEFVDYWRGVPGSRGLKLDWIATWRNRMREVAGRQTSRPQRRDEAVPHYWAGVVQ
jgi:hypothetical protein